MTTEPRQSEVAYIVVCLRVDNAPHFLLSHHSKWGDWTLVGGHLEPFEHGNWADAAAREVQEELSSLKHRRDFVLVPIFSRPVVWGPTPSRSAGNLPTVYRAQFFAMEFLKEPALLLAQLAQSELRLVSQSELDQSPLVAYPIKVLSEHLAGGLTSVPLSWQDGIDRRKLPESLFAE